MPLDLPTGAETNHGQVRQKYNDSLTYLDNKPSGGGGDYYLSGNANYIPTFNAIASSPISNAITTIVVGGRVAEGDCRPFRMKVGGAGAPETWFGKWSTTSAAGTGATARNWTYVIEGDEVWFEQSGAPHDTYNGSAVSCNPWFEATKAFFKVNYGGDQPFPSFPILWMTHRQTDGGWFFDQTIVLNGGRWSLRGSGVGKSGGAPTIMRWWAGIETTGIIIDNIGTLNGDARPGGANLDGADGSVVDGLFIWKSAYGGPTIEAPAVYVRGRIIFSNNRVIGWDGHGLTIYADVQTPSVRGNANCFLIAANSFEGNRGFGVALFGADANAGMLYNNTAIANWQGGCWDGTFLGNDHYNWHIETSPQLKTQVDTSDKPPTYVAHATASVPGVYFLVAGNNPAAQQALGSTTEPGTDPSVWELAIATNDPGSIQVPWVSGMAVRIGGTFVTTNINNRVNVFGIYCESGIVVPMQLCGRTYVKTALDAVGLSRASENTGAFVDWDNIRIAGSFSGSWFDNDADPYTTTKLQIDVGGKKNVLRWKRGRPGFTETDYWQIKSLQNGSYALTTDSNQTRDLYESAFFLGATDTIGSGYNGPAAPAYNGYLHFRYFRYGEKGASRSLGISSVDPSGQDFGRGDRRHIDQPKLGGNEGWVFYQGAAETGGSFAAEIGYVRWRVNKEFNPGTIAAGSVTAWDTIAAPGAEAGDLIAEASILGDAAGHGLILQYEVITNLVRFRLVNPAGASSVTPGTVRVRFNIRKSGDDAQQVVFGGRTYTFWSYPSSNSFIPRVDGLAGTLAAGGLRLIGSSPNHNYASAITPLSSLTNGVTYNISVPYVAGANSLGLIIATNIHASSGRLVDLSGTGSSTLSTSFVMAAGLQLALQVANGSGVVDVTSVTIT